MMTVSGMVINDIKIDGNSLPTTKNVTDNRGKNKLNNHFQLLYEDCNVGEVWKVKSGLGRCRCMHLQGNKGESQLLSIDRRSTVDRQSIELGERRAVDQRSNDSTI